MTTVLIAVDATDSSVHAVETAHRLFGDDAEYLVLNVGADSYVPVPIFPNEVGMITPMAWAPIVQSHGATGEASNERAESAVSSEVDVAETIAKQTGQEGGLSDATALGIVGDPSGSIIDVALDHGADLIVVGTHERGWLTRLLTSSVADEVRRGSPIPVLVVPRPVGDESDH